MTPSFFSLLLGVFSVYFIAANLTYGILLLLSWVSIKKRRNLVHSETTPQVQRSISIIVPAYNEEAMICSSIQGFLNSSYNNFEVMVVDDGSSDQTTRKIIEHFKMKPVYLKPISRISSIKVKATWRSSINNRLILICQEHAGKAQAINTGISFSNSELICTADADSLPETNALSIMAREFDHPKVVAVGSALRILNGSITNAKHDQVLEGQLPKGHPLVMLQILEYIRSFYCGRTGWNFIRATHLLSGAFAMFRKDSLLRVRGFDEKSITEDFEVVMRLVKQTFSRKKGEQVILIPEPLCWTQVPQNLSNLRRQRLRWQRGLIETVLGNMRMLFNPKYKGFGFTAMPYLFFFELMGPIIELFAYVLVGTGLFCGYLQTDTVLEILAFGITYTLLITFLAVEIEEHFFARHKNRKKKSVLKLMAYSLIDILLYRQLNWIWRLQASFQYAMKQKQGWGINQRSDVELITNSQESSTDHHKKAA